MEPDSLALTGKTFASRRQLSADRMVAILWNSAFKSLYRAFLIMVLGEVALGIAGSIWSGMAPSKGPGISFLPGHWGGWTSAVKGHRLGILWAICFVSISGFRLAWYLPDARHRNFVRRLRRIERKVSKNWFHLMVGNAIGALVSTFVISMVSRFSWSAMLWNAVIQPVIAWVFHLFALLVGAGASGVVQEWMNWYGDNQFRFMFWSIYLVSIADDLGLPNVKTLGRWVWMRVRRRFGGETPEQSRLDGVQ